VARRFLFAAAGDPVTGPASFWNGRLLHAFFSDCREAEILRAGDAERFFFRTPL